MKILCVILIALLELVPKGPAMLNQLQKRDSILVADQVEYGFALDSVQASTVFHLPDIEGASNDTLTVVRGWQLDTTGVSQRNKTYSLKGSIILAPFEEGTYMLPDLRILRAVGARVDTLLFEVVKMEVKTMPVDTATFVPHDIKAQIRYPLTFKEILPWIGGGALVAGLVAAMIWWLRSRRKAREEEKRREPAHITALRNLDRYRGNKFWAPDKQKAFYSGVTDTLKTYMEARFGVDAPEMTTAELFDALKSEKDITPEVYGETKELFEIADFVKFAKHSAPDDYNAKVVPVAVHFVTDTYQTALEEEPKEDVL